MAVIDGRNRMPDLNYWPGRDPVQFSLRTVFPSPHLDVKDSVRWSHPGFPPWPRKQPLAIDHLTRRSRLISVHAKLPIFRNGHVTLVLSRFTTKSFSFLRRLRSWILDKWKTVQTRKSKQHPRPCQAENVLSESKAHICNESQFFSARNGAATTQFIVSMVADDAI